MQVTVVWRIMYSYSSSVVEVLEAYIWTDTEFVLKRWNLGHCAKMVLKCIEICYLDGPEMDNSHL